MDYFGDKHKPFDIFDIFVSLLTCFIVLYFCLLINVLHHA